MRTLGRYKLLQQIEFGSATETWVALGPDSEQVRLSQILPTMQGDLWIQGHVERIRSASSLRAPWIPTHFIGEEAGELIQVQPVRWGVRLNQLATPNAPLPPAVALWCAVELCHALEQASGLPYSSLGIDERELIVGWDGVLQVGGFDLETLPPALAYDLADFKLRMLSPEEARGQAPTGPSEVFRVCAVLSRLLTGIGAFPRDTEEALVNAICHGLYQPHRLLRGLGENLGALIDRNLNPDPSQRQPDCMRLRIALEPHAAERSEAMRELSTRALTGFPAQHCRELARSCLGTNASKVEPLPNDHVEKVQSQRDTEGDWLVLGDWFQGHAHPRGRLIALQMQGDESTEAEQAALALEAEALVQQHAELRVPDGGMDPRFDWRWGYVERAELAWIDSLPALRLMLAHPSMRFLAELAVLTGDDERVAGILPLAHLPVTLKVLQLPRLSHESRVLRKLLPNVPRIERARRIKPRPANRFFVAPAKPGAGG